jgi:hypothetical protein
MCASEDSIGSRAGEPRAPEAGAWFISQLVELACRSDLEHGEMSADVTAEECNPVAEAVGLKTAEPLPEEEEEEDMMPVHESFNRGASRGRSRRRGKRRAIATTWWSVGAWMSTTKAGH